MYPTCTCDDNVVRGHAVDDCLIVLAAVQPLFPRERISAPATTATAAPAAAAAAAATPTGAQCGG